MCFFSDTDSSNVFAAVAKLLRDRETDNERQNQAAFSCGNVRDDDDGGGGGGGNSVLENVQGVSFPPTSTVH